MRQMHMVGFLGSGTVDEMGGWRHEAADPRLMDAAMWEGVAQTLEEAKFDAAFFADSYVFYGRAHIERGGLMYMMDPLPLAMSVLRATTHLGVGVTVSTSFNEAFVLARTLGTMDLLSGGRMAWNVVTSSFDREAQLFGMERILERDARYDRATEVVEACLQLWDSFAPDAFVLDKKTGQFIDGSRLKEFEYRGKYVKTNGPLTLPQSPQGRPIIMQAGASERGRQFAARFGEVLFTIASSFDEAQKYYADVKRRVAEAGRRPEDCKILQLVNTVVGETEQIARDRLAYAESLLDDDVAIEWASASTGSNLVDLPPDSPLDSLSGSREGSTAYLQRLQAVQRDAGRSLTIREAARLYCLQGSPKLVGTAEQIADHLQMMFENGAADGFVVGASLTPGSHEDFARTVVPILQERGLFRTEYPGTTLRDSLYA